MGGTPPQFDVRLARFWPIYITIGLLLLIAYIEHAENDVVRETILWDRQISAPFMRVQGMSYNQGYVTTTRVVDVNQLEYPQGVVADWVVTVVADDSKPPSCQTRPSRDVGSGWNIYNQFEPTTQTWSLDRWVGDEGCFDRLTPGRTYTMHVVWLPRDTALRPSRASMTFVP